MSVGREFKKYRRWCYGHYSSIDGKQERVNSMTNQGFLNLKTWSEPELCSPDSDEKVNDARGSDWRNKNLGSLDLSGSKLCRCDLRGTDLSQCNLRDADLRLAIYDNTTKTPDDFDIRTSGAVGPGAKLNGVYLNNTDLRGIDLRGAALLGAYLSGTDLSGAILDNVSLAGSDLRSATMRGTMCRNTRFGTCEMDLVDLRGADLEGAALDTVQSIKGADFSFCRGLENQVDALLARSAMELDCWNPYTRSTTRSSLESLIRK